MAQDPEPSRDQPSEPQYSGQMYSQSLKHTSVGARVPEGVRAGTFATGTTILQTTEEFVIDFLSTMVPPQQVAARVVLTPTTFGQMIAALQTNLGRYQQQFGRVGTRPRPETPPAQIPPVPGTSQEVVAAAGPDVGGETTGTPGEAGGEAGQAPGAHGAHPPAVPQPRVEDLYEQLKLPDELLGGVYANVVMIRHTPEEFCFDFIANFFPRSVVTCRVFMAAGRVQAFLDAMQNAMRRSRPRPPAPPV